MVSAVNAPSPVDRPQRGDGGRHGVDVHAAKLAVPGSAGALLWRESIAHRIAARSNVRVVLVRAPAGFGKTTAMLQGHGLLEKAGVPTAWLNLDAADNDVSRFVSCLSACLRRLQADDRFDDAAPLDLLDAVGREVGAFTLFLDDFEVLHSTAVLGLVRELIDRLPGGASLVIGSRSLPDLGLGRLRARGQLTEIDADVLRFSRDETGRYLQLRGGAGLADESLDRLHGKTEGWVAALWLASVALESNPAAEEFIARFSGSSGTVADYLAEDVLARQPDDVRDFLLRTSVLRQLTVPLCEALVPGVDAAAMLQRLVTGNVFLSPIEGDETSFRYHALFAAFLRNQLRRTHPDALTALHLAASLAYEADGRPVPAIDHAIEAGAVERATGLLGRHAQAFLEQGRMRLLARWFDALPSGSLDRLPWLRAVSVWAVCFTHGPREALAALQASACADSALPEVREQIDALHPLLLAMMDRYDEAYEAGQRRLSRPWPTQSFASSVLSNAMAHVVAVLGQQREAHRLLDVARRLHTGSTFSRMYTETTEGMLDLEQARLRQATARLRMAVTSAPAHSGARGYGHAGGNAWAGVLYAAVVYEADDTQTAERLLNVYLPLARDAALPDHMIASHVMRSRLDFQRGDVDGALRVLTELEYLGHDRQLPRIVASAKLERARLLLLQGNALASRDELDRADDPAVWERVARQHLAAHEVEDLRIGRMRWQLHFGDAKAAATDIERAIVDAVAGQRLHRALKLRVLSAMAQTRLGHHGAAGEALMPALVEAAREGYRRLFLDEGPALAETVHHVAARLREGDRSTPPLLLDLVEQLAHALGPVPLQGAASASDTADVLTQKELHVLRLVSEGYANGAMAEKLFVSESTVRTHLRNVNVKLNAGNRTQAVAIARRQGLIR